MANTYTGRLLTATQAPLRGAVSREDHYYAIVSDYIYREDEIDDRCSGTVGRYYQGQSLPPRALLAYYRDGSRCPAVLRRTVADYIAARYRSRARLEGLRAGLTTVLAALPPEDAADILSGCPEGDLADLWTRLAWYALCQDYADRAWPL